MPECIRRVYSQTEGRVRVLGWSNDVVNFLGAIDALVLPSQYESFGYVIAEAWCAGLPIASTLVGIAKERPRWVAPIEQPVTPETVKDAIIRLSGAKCLVDVQTARKRFDVKPWREAWLDALCD
jgi:glycosyltransferase involved in cell wall biosynthesis